LARSRVFITCNHQALLLQEPEVPFQSRRLNPQAPGEVADEGTAAGYNFFKYAPQRARGFRGRAHGRTTLPEWLSLSPDRRSRLPDRRKLLGIVNVVQGGSIEYEDVCVSARLDRTEDRMAA